MAEGYENFYSGGEFAFDNPVGMIGGTYNPSAGSIAFPSDPLTANQISAVTKKISSGTKNVEVSGLGLMGGSAMKHLASIPKHHWREIERLKKLTGTELTFHGPLVEPTGASGQGGWTEDKRSEVQQQMSEAVGIAQQLNPKGNTIVTFHASNGLQPVSKKVKNPVTGKEEDVQLSVFNSRTGEIGVMPFSPEDYFADKEKYDLKTQLRSLNNTQWTDQMEKVVMANNRARKEIEEALSNNDKLANYFSTSDPAAAAEQLYDLSKPSPYYSREDNIRRQQQFKGEMAKLQKLDPNLPVVFQNQVANKLDDANFFVEDAFLNLKSSYNLAYHNAKLDLEKGGAYAKEAKFILGKLNKYKKDYNKLQQAKFERRAGIREEFDIVNNGVKFLQQLKPQIYRPLDEFGYAQAGKSFGNVAFEAYKKFGNHAPIISIENPPAGMTGFTRADEIKKLVKRSRKVFVDNAIKSKGSGGLGLSASDAKAQAEKLIGATWDVGHINSIRKWGYSKKDVIKEAKTIAPYVKHMHLADNLGFEDAELPIGMGNVPIQEILASHENFRKAKKVIETGDWYSRQGGLAMSHTPIGEALSFLGSPVYSMGQGQGPYWSEASNVYGGYFSGLGTINPPVHHSIYGAGFTNLPASLGGEIPGQSSFSGAPME